MNLIKTKVFLLAAFCTAPCFAQQNVVVVDMGRIFREHAGFKASVESLQKEVEAFKLKIQQDRQTIQKESEALAAMDRSSAAFKEKEAAIAKAAADMQVNHNVKNREFMQREAGLYFQTYAGVLNTVQGFCEQNNIALVVRFSGDKMDPTNRASVLSGVTNAVVYQRNRDITDAIIQVVNRNSGVANQNNNLNR